MLVSLLNQLNFLIYCTYSALYWVIWHLRGGHILRWKFEHLPTVLASRLQSIVWGMYSSEGWSQLIFGILKGEEHLAICRWDVRHLMGFHLSVLATSCFWLVNVNRVDQESDWRLLLIQLFRNFCQHTITRWQLCWARFGHHWIGRRTGHACFLSGRVWGSFSYQCLFLLLVGNTFNFTQIGLVFCRKHCIQCDRFSSCIWCL